MGRDEVVRTAVAAAARVAERADVVPAGGSTAPVVLQDSNNVVAWLAPHPVVAKVGPWGHSAEVLGREVAVCSHLTRRGAPVAAPLGPLLVDEPSGLPVTLWARAVPVDDEPAPGAVAAMLDAVHEALLGCPVPLPPYLGAIDRAREVLVDDDRMAALGGDDRALLRTAFDRWHAAARRVDLPGRPLHGEPHTGNVVVTARGPVLVDFEAASVGPREWDVASVPPEVVAHLAAVDEEALRVLWHLNRARVATWCWALADHPEMRRHAEHHLQVLRTASDA